MENGCWTRAPRGMVVETGWVHVVRLRLDLLPGRLAALRALLSPDEIVRADRYRSPRDGARFTAARGQLREVLAGYTQIPPKSITFQLSPHGKPALTGDGPAFNISHSADLAVVAVACSGEPLGIDVEAIRTDLEFEDMARRFFAYGEVAALLALPPEQRTDAFFACWTRKEAYLKARGLGLLIPLDGFEVSLVPDEPPRLLWPADDDPLGAEWAMWQIDPGPGYTAALCARGSIDGKNPTRIRCWDWPPQE